MPGTAVEVYRMIITNGSIIDHLGATATLTTRDKISTFANLDKGWSYGEGDPFAATVIQNAKQIADKALDDGFLETAAFPGLRGNIVVSVYIDKSSTAEFSVEPNDRINLYVELENGADTEEPNLLLETALQRIATFKREWTLSASSIQSTTTLRNDDLSALLSNSPVITGYQSWTSSARYEQAVMSVTTSVSSTTKSLVPLLYTGGSVVKFCQHPAA